MSRHLHAKNDKDKIAGWRLELNRMLHVFNVRSIASVGRSLILYSQTELLMNTHAVVSGIEHSVRDIHRTIVQGQGEKGDNNSPVSDSQVS